MATNEDWEVVPSYDSPKGSALVKAAQVAAGGDTHEMFTLKEKIRQLEADNATLAKKYANVQVANDRLSRAHPGYWTNQQLQSQMQTLEQQVRNIDGALQLRTTQLSAAHAKIRELETIVERYQHGPAKADTVEPWTSKQRVPERLPSADNGSGKPDHPRIGTDGPAQIEYRD